MKFVNPLPFLLDYSLFAIALLRVTVAYFTLQNASYFYHGKSWWKVTLSVVSVVAGLMLIVGLYTQIAAIAAIILFIVSIRLKGCDCECNTGANNTKPLLCGCQKSDQTTYAVLIIVALCLLALGAGKLSFDLPL